MKEVILHSAAQAKRKEATAEKREDATERRQGTTDSAPCGEIILFESSGGDIFERRQEKGEHTEASVSEGKFTQSLTSE